MPDVFGSTTVTPAVVERRESALVAPAEEIQPTRKPRIAMVARPTGTMSP
jgi:hypothetical protein